MRLNLKAAPALAALALVMLASGAAKAQTVVEELLAAAARGGDFVEYYDGG